jgi:hypothetical protein
MKRLVYQDMGTKKNYFILFPAVNSTVDRSGEKMIIYRDGSGNYFCKDEKEFFNNFEMKEVFS